MLGPQGIEGAGWLHSRLKLESVELELRGLLKRVVASAAA